MNTLYKGLALMCFAMALVAQPSFAYEKAATSSGAQLAAISRQMAEEGNDHFIIVEALKDSLILDGKPYEFYCTKDNVTIDGAALPADIKRRYLVLINNFIEGHPKIDEAGNVDHMDGWRMSSDGVKLEDVLNPQSSFRNPPKAPKSYSAETKTIIAEMGKDGIVDPTKPVSILYSLDGVVVNGKALSAALDAKYRKMFLELEHYVPTKHGTGLTIYKH